VWELRLEPLVVVIAVFNNLLLESMRWLSRPRLLRAASTAAVLNKLLHTARTKMMLSPKSVYAWELREQLPAAAVHTLLLHPARLTWSKALAAVVHTLLLVGTDLGRPWYS
jgi:hypothetical protein